MVGLQAVMTLPCILCMVVGVFVGIIFGCIPGLSATMVLAMFLPVTYSMDTVTAIVLLVALYIGGISGGLISAILTGIPGTPSSVATCFDGWPLTQKGKGVKALGVGIVASFAGTILSTIILIFLSPALASIAIKFGAYEYFAVAVFSLTMMSGLSGGNIYKGLISGLCGCIFATVGIDSISGVQRFTMGNRMLSNGFNILPVLIGLFAVAEIAARAAKVKTEKPSEGIKISMKDVKGFGFSMAEAKSQIHNFFLCSLIGTGIGILPGIGGGAANVLAYSVSKASCHRSKKVSDDVAMSGDDYGTGVIDGVVASESSNNAAIGGALVPLLALGIPGDTVTAMLLGGLTLHGVTPGPLMFTSNVDIVYSVFLTMIIGTIIMLFMEFYGLRLFALLLGIPMYFLLPAIFLYCVVGSYGVRNNLFDVITLIVFGVVGFVFAQLKIPSAPFILGFLIGPLMETNLRRGLMFASGDFGQFFTQPIADVFFAAAVISICFSIRSQRKPRKKSKYESEEDD